MEQKPSKSGTKPEEKSERKNPPKSETVSEPRKTVSKVEEVTKSPPPKTETVYEPATKVSETVTKVEVEFWCHTKDKVSQ